ncbi:hypothetical protein AGMMS49546_22170 [Spirochaetia bacterium]|nr:hypothetical protein AGMMS49546_22170 [Spirochaetia bacterium]
MLESAIEPKVRRDPNAPGFLQITIKESEGKERSTTIALGLKELEAMLK